MQYLILSRADTTYAAELSKRLYRQTRPNPDPADITKYYVGWITHPADGRVALVFPDTDQQPIHNQADPEIIVRHIETVLTESEKQVIRDNVNNAKGKRENPLNLLPQKFRDALKTQTAMDADGWFSKDV